MKRQYCVYLVQALGLLCIAAGLYLGWVQQLAADAAAIREALTEPLLAGQAAAAWHSFPESVLVAMRGPVFWIGLAIVIAAPWLPIPDSQGRRVERPAPGPTVRVVERRVPASEQQAARVREARPPRKIPLPGRSARVLDPPAPRA